MVKKYKWDSKNGHKRCGHPYCGQCQTRRGNNRGNRNLRHHIKTALLNWRRLLD